MSWPIRIRSPGRTGGRRRRGHPAACGTVRADLGGTPGPPTGVRFKKTGTFIQTTSGPGASNNRGCHRMTKVRTLIGSEASSDSTALAGSGPTGGPKHLKETYRSVDSSIAEFGVGLPLPPCRSLNGCGQTVRFDHHSPGAGPRRQPFPGSRTSPPPGAPERVDNRSVTSPPSENCDPAAPCETPLARVNRQRCLGR